MIGVMMRTPLSASSLRVAQRMALAHIAKPGNQYTDHFTAPDVSPRISCREKIM